MKFFRRIFAAADRDTFVDLFLGVLRQKQPEAQFDYRSEDFSVQSSHGRINLANFYAEYCQLPWHKRKSYIERTVQIFTSVRDELPEDFEDARRNLMPKIWMRSSFSHQALLCRADGKTPPDLDAEPLGDHLLTTIVYDLPDSMQTIPPQQFEIWDISSYEAWEIAIENLAERTRAMAKIGEHLISAVSGDNYDANRLFLIDRLRELGLDGDLVAMIPNRDTLYVSRVNDPVGLRMMIELSDAALQNEPRPMSPFPLQLRDGEWVDWTPPVNHVMYPKLQEMRARYLQGEYAEQKTLIEKIQSRDDVEDPLCAFIATYSVLQKKDSSEILSYSVWGEGVDTLLPETDRVVLIKSRDKSEGFVPWGRVLEVMGADIEEVPGLYPKRFRVREFPTAEQIAEMEPTEVP